jgi:copper ion binding protein
MSTTSIEHATLTAPDISCGHCVAAIKEGVGGLAGVANVEANVDTKRVDVAFDPNRVSLAQIEAALDEAGYPVQR